MECDKERRNFLSITGARTSQRLAAVLVNSGFLVPGIVMSTSQMSGRPEPNVMLAFFSLMLAFFFCSYTAFLCSWWCAPRIGIYGLIHTHPLLRYGTGDRSRRTSGVQPRHRFCPRHTCFACRKHHLALRND